MDKLKTKVDEADAFLDFCDVMCPNCNQLWVSSLKGDPFPCLKCQCEIDPSKHVVVESEKEIN